MSAKNTTKKGRPPTRIERMIKMARNEWRIYLILIISAMILGAFLADQAR